MYCFLLEVIGF